jgi:hypothetical protein
MGPATTSKESVFQLMSCLLLMVLLPLMVVVVEDALFLPQEANGLPPSVRDLIYPPRDEPVPSLQANPAHASEPATVSSPVTAPTAAPISPSALAATRFRDTHGSVTPPDPPWTATTTSLISPTKKPEQGARLSLSSLWHTLEPHLDGSMLSSGPLFYANDAQNLAVTATGKLLVSGVVDTVLFDTGAGRSCMVTDAAAKMLQRGRARVVGSLLAQQLWTISSLFMPTWHYLLAPLFQWRKIFLLSQHLRPVSSSWESFCSPLVSWIYPADFSIIFAGPWQRKHRISLDGRVVRCLTLVAAHDFIITPCRRCWSHG